MKIPLQDFSQKILPFWIAAAITALVSVVYAQVFSWSEGLALQWGSTHPLYAFFIIPSAVLISASMAMFIAPMSSGSGIPQIIAAVEGAPKNNPIVTQLLSIKTIVTKFIGSCLCVAGGGVTGREGPNLQVAAGIFHYVHKKWPNAKIDTQSMILAGGAAGLASAFNTPLGGIIFAIEELAKVHVSYVRTAVFHSVIIAGILAQMVLGNYLYIGRINIERGDLANTILLGFVTAIIGIIGALMGAAIVKVHDWRATLNLRSKFIMTLICGLAVATIFYFEGTDAIGSGRGLIVKLLTHTSDPAEWQLGFVRLFSNYFTYVGGVIGGIFAPALSTGAAFGAWASEFVVGSNPQLWILAGMVAFLTGLSRTPFTSLILVLEMTDSHGVILVLMIAAILSHAAARLIDPISFYEHMAHRILNGGSKSHNEALSKPETPVHP